VFVLQIRRAVPSDAFCIHPNPATVVCLTCLALRFMFRSRFIKSGPWAFRRARHPDYSRRRQSAIRSAHDNRESGKRTRDREPVRPRAVAAARMPNDAFITIPDTIYGETRIYFFTRKSSFVSSPVTIKRSVGNISLILISTTYHLTANFEHRA